MKSEELLRCLNSVEDKYIEELLEDYPASVKSVNKRKQWGTLAACIAAVFLSAGLMLQNVTHVDVGKTELVNSANILTMATNSVVMLDVNPSIRLEVNDRGKVVSSDALNDDAQSMSDEFKFVGKDVDEAVTSAVKVLQEHEYITNLKNSVLVTVLDADKDKADELCTELVDTINKNSGENDYSLSVLSQTMIDESKYKELAESNHISTGRVMMIQKFCSEHSDYSFEKLVQYNIQTLNQLMEYAGLPETMSITGAAAGTVPNEYREKLGLEDLNCEDMMNFICAISDFYNKLSDYYSESDVAKQVGYVFDIALSKTQDGDKIWAVIAESVTKNVGSHGAIINVGDNAIIDWYNQSTIHKVAKYLTDKYLSGMVDVAA